MQIGFLASGWNGVLSGALVALASAGTPSIVGGWQATPPAVDFQAVDLQGGSFQGTSLKGQIVLVDFWAVWCPPCIAAIPTLNRLNKDLGPKDFRVLGVAVYSGTCEDVAQFVRAHGMDYTVVVGDEDLLERFQVIGFPTYVLLGPDGNVYRTYVGEMGGLERKLREDVAALARRERKRREEAR